MNRILLSVLFCLPLAVEAADEVSASAAAGGPAPRVMIIRNPGLISSRNNVAPAGASSPNGISYHNGPLMVNGANVYLIWYGNWIGDPAVPLIENLVRRAEGATLADLVAATGWQQHSVRAVLSGLRKAGHNLLRDRNAEGESRYRIGEAS